jgi:hypothetical protein
MAIFGFIMREVDDEYKERIQIQMLLIQQLQ